MFNVGLGIISMVLFPFLLPGIAILALFALPLLPVVALLALLMPLALLARALGRLLSRRASSGRAPAAAVGPQASRSQ